MSRDEATGQPARGAGEPGPYVSQFSEDVVGRRKRAFTLRDLMILAFYHGRTILLTALLPLAVGIGAAISTKTQYTADGLLLVVVNREYQGNQDITGSGPAVLSIEGLKAVESEIQIVRSSEVIKQVLVKLGPERLFPRLATNAFVGFLQPLSETERLEKATELFRDRLTAEVQSDSNIMAVAFRHPDADLAAEAVNVLIDAYLDRRREIFADPRSPFLLVEVQRLGRQLDAVEAEIEQVKADYGVLDIQQDVLLAANQADSILQRMRQVSERREAVKYESEKAEVDLAAVPERVFDYYENSNQTDNNDDHNLIVKLMLERDHLAEQYSSDYPAIREIDRKLDTVRKAMRGQDREVFFWQREVRNPLLDFMHRQVLELRAETGALDRQLVELDRQRKQAEQRIAELRDAQAHLQNLERSRDLIADIHREYAMRAEAARIAEDANKQRNANVSVVQWASAPITGSSLALSYLLAGVVGAVLLGAAAGGLATFLRQVYILPSEAEDELGLATLAEFSGADLNFDAPEARRELLHLASLLLDVRKDEQQLQLLQFVSTNPDDGVTPLVRALAVELAQGRGLRTLLIDLNKDWREQLKVLGVTNQTETAANGELTMVASGVPQLWIAAEPLSSPLVSLRTPMARARMLMEQLRGYYDVVIFIAPRQTFGHLAQRLSSMVDANVLVVRAEQTRGPAVAQIRDIVLRAGGDLLGFVFTGRRYYIPKAVYRWL